MKVIKDDEKIKEVLSRGVARIYPQEVELFKVLSSGTKIKVYCGYDPTSPTLHLGHMITLKKLAQFQKLGHQVIMLIGDFTGMIGDPTDKLAVRKKLSREDVLKNAKNYKKMASKFLSFSGKNPAKIVFNSKWQDKLNFLQLIEIASNFTVLEMLARDMFQERIKRKKPIYLHEFLYPLAQGIDSLFLDVGLEIGGKDQIFNMLCGRKMVKIIKGKEKFVLAVKLLIDPTGKKMGKTEANLIPLDATADEIYGKIMSWPDNLILPGLELLTDIPMEKISEIKQRIKKKEFNPRDAKMLLAKELVCALHSERLAKKAKKEFNRIFCEKKLPSKIKAIKIKKKEIEISDLLVKAQLAPSKSQAKRLTLQGAVKLGGKKIKNWKSKIKIKKGTVVQVGKLKFAKIYLKTRLSKNFGG